MDWDAFISHAWEDKEDIARPLAEALRRRGLRVWYDEFTLTLGDSLRRSIDRGLAQSRYGIVILSPNFFAKEWPQKELDGLAAREVGSGKVILPVWHNVTWEDVRRFSPTLADKLAVSTAKGLDAVVEEILRALRVDLKESTGEEHRPRPRPMAKPTPAKPRRTVNWERVGAIAGVIAVLVALSAWLVPNAADFLSVRLSGIPKVTPTQTPTITPVPTPTPIVVAVMDNVWIRDGPSDEARRVAILRRRISGVALAVYGDWVQVQTELIRGWVPLDSVIFFAAKIPPAIITLTPVGTPTPVPPTDTPMPIPPISTRVTPTHAPTPFAPPGMVYVPAGEFIMGSNEGESHEQPVHTVYLDDFWIDRYEVTNEQFAGFVAATSYQTEAERLGGGWVWKGSEGEEVKGANWRHPHGPDSSIEDKMDHPVVLVSWNDANAYCQWAGKRLTTEAEWEKAARGTDGWMYPWGDTFDGSKLSFCDANCLCDWKNASADDGYAYTAPVGSYPAGASPFGALDMAGNVWEWVADWYNAGYYKTPQPEHNPPGPNSGEYRVIRGGSWFTDLGLARCAYRTGGWPPGRYNDIGFRCAKDSQ